MHVAFLLPSSVVTVMDAIPAFTAVTFPVLSIVATAGFEDIHATVLFATSVGFTVDVKVSVFPTIRLSVILFILTDIG